MCQNCKDDDYWEGVAEGSETRDKWDSMDIATRALDAFGLGPGYYPERSGNEDRDRGRSDAFNRRHD